MLWLFQKIADRLKALFLADVALDVETQFLTRQAERKATLLRQAQEYETQGLDDLSAELRQRAESLTTEKPLASILPAINHLGGEKTEADTPKLSNTSNASSTRVATNGTAKKTSQPRSKRKSPSR